jgi:hypothetical protein
MLQADGIAFTILVAEDEQVLSDDGAHQPRPKVDVAHGADLGVRHVEVSIDQGQAARLREPGLVERTGEQTFPTGSGERRDRAGVEVE